MEVEQKTRLVWLDALRGICVLLMILDHFAFWMCDMFYPSWSMSIASVPWLNGMYEFVAGIYMSDARYYIRIVVVFLFIMISGISSTFSRNNLVRGLKLALVALALTAVTAIADHFDGEPDSQMLIVFGILHMLACCMLLYGFLCMFDRRLFGKFRLIHLFSIILAIVCIVPVPYLPIVSNNKFLFIFGIPYPGFVSADYFPLIPYMGFFFIGVLVGGLISRKAQLPSMINKCLKPTAFVGRHALIIYLAHVPIVYAILEIIGIITLKISTLGLL